MTYLLNNLFIYADILQNEQEKKKMDTIYKKKKKKQLLVSTSPTNHEIQQTGTITQLFEGGGGWKVEKLAEEARASQSDGR